VSANADPIHEVLRRRALRLTRAASTLSLAAFAVWFVGVVLGFTRGAEYWVAGLPAAVLIFSVEELVQRRANRVRAEYVSCAARQDARPPLLVLRSFSQPVLTEKRSTYHLRGGGFGEERGTTFLWQLSEAAEPFGRLLAIGEPSGGQRLSVPEAVFFVTTDETWFEVFCIAARSSRAVVLIPDVSEGVSREIRALREFAAADKLFIFMPPTEKPHPSWTPFRARDPDAFATRWSTMREAWEREGYRLPVYDVAGMIYRAAADLSVREAVGLERFASIPALREALYQLLPPATVNCASLAETIEELERLGATVLAGRN
jgi:hypothetical protein